MNQNNTFQLWIGLGNFSQQYIHTRHNIGSDFLWYLYPKESWTDYKLFFFINKNFNNNCIFIIPKLYMNVSGEIFKDIYLKKIILEHNPEIIIIHDDLEIPFGQFKFRNNKERGERGHNGNRSINNALKEIQGKKYITPYYLSIGIGRPEDGIIDKWVLRKFSLQEIHDLENIIYTNLKKQVSILLKEEL